MHIYTWNPISEELDHGVEVTVLDDQGNIGFKIEDITVILSAKNPPEVIEKDNKLMVFDGYLRIGKGRALTLSKEKMTDTTNIVVIFPETEGIFAYFGTTQSISFRPDRWATKGLYVCHACDMLQVLTMKARRIHIANPGNGEYPKVLRDTSSALGFIRDYWLPNKSREDLEAAYDDAVTHRQIALVRFLESELQLYSG